MTRMLVVRRLTEDMLNSLTPISDASLVGEETILRIGRSGFTLGYTPLNTAEWRVFPPLGSATPEQAVHDPDAACFAAYQEDSFVGIAVIRASESGWGELADIRVDAAHRRSGVAHALLAACERFAIKRELHGLRVATSDQNPVMCQFCEHNGFQLQGLDRMTLILRPEEKFKPLSRRSVALYFYLTIKKG